VARLLIRSSKNKDLKVELEMVSRFGVLGWATRRWLLTSVPCWRGSAPSTRCAARVPASSLALWLTVAPVTRPRTPKPHCVPYNDPVFQVKTFAKLWPVYAKKFEVDEATLAFKFEGRKLAKDDTPERVDMEPFDADEDNIQQVDAVY
jgi:hypothetical protein